MSSWAAARAVPAGEDTGDEEPVPHLVMELVEGDTSAGLLLVATGGGGHSASRAFQIISATTPNGSFDLVSRNNW